MKIALMEGNDCDLSFSLSCWACVWVNGSQVRGVWGHNMMVIWLSGLTCGMNVCWKCAHIHHSGAGVWLVMCACIHVIEYYILFNLIFSFYISCWPNSKLNYFNFIVQPCAVHKYLFFFLNVTSLIAWFIILDKVLGKFKICPDYGTTGGKVIG